jgi:hypothetical protein
MSKTYVHVYQADLDEMQQIAARGRPLDAEEMRQRPSVVHDDFATFAREQRLKPVDREVLAGGREGLIDFAPFVGDLIFPREFHLHPFFCICSSYQWSIVPGEPGVSGPHLVLKCVYTCFDESGG